MARLHLVKTTDGEYLLQGIGDPSANADFSLYDLDGEGGDPFAYGNQQWKIVPGVESDEYDEDEFWAARDVVLQSAVANGILDADVLDE